MSPVTRAAADCLWMLAALPPGGDGAAAGGAPALPVPPHVWEEARAHTRPLLGLT
jgi:hypothetical protein